MNITKKNKIKNILKSDNLPFIIFFIILIVMHLGICKISGDDFKFSEELLNNDFFTYLLQRYDTWSSRVIIEASLISILQYGLTLWKILNIIIYIILAKSISKICNEKNNKMLNYAICGLILLIPISVVSNTGWVSTTTNYLWVVSLGLYSISVIKDSLNNIKIPWWKIILSILFTIYACNQEQMAVAMFIVLAGILIYQLIKNKKNISYIIKKEKLLLVLLIITIVSLIFILTCPGNLLRKTKEIDRWYPEYINLNIVEKVELGVTSIMSNLILNTNYIFIIFTLILAYGAWKTQKNKLIKLICVIPAISSVVFTIFREYIILAMPQIEDVLIQFNQQTLIMKTNDINISTILFMMYYIFILLAIPTGMYFIFKNKKEFYICSGIYCVGFITRFIMGFSPTVFASGIRTFIFLYISFIMISLMICNKLILKNKINEREERKIK